MSVILITNHDECIYHLSEKEESTHNKRTSMYKSIHRDRVRVPPSHKRAHATMGLPRECPPDPHQFLRKHSADKQLSPLPPKSEKPQSPRRNNGIPTREEVRQFDQKRMEVQRKNFVVRNIKTVLRMKPKEPKQRVVVDVHGTSKGLLEGLEPIYIKSSVFAKTPKYLNQFIAEREKFHQMMRDHSGAEKSKCQYITRDERERLLNGLKHNWEELQKQYQGLPILTDTIPKKVRKSKLEAELKQLEKDIVLIERHPYIYVYDDD